MTAEIVILNKGAVALAADSAVTFGAGRKIYNTVNKLVTLSKYRPVGIMIHGGAEFMGIPWLRQYADGFIDWIKSSNLLFPPTLQQQFLLGGVRAGFQEFKNQMQHRVSDSIKKHGPISETGVKQIVGSFSGSTVFVEHQMPQPHIRSVQK